MTEHGDPGGTEPDGGRTAPRGTAFPVDVARDRRARVTWAVFLAGPLIWFSHFMVVYLVAEAGCTGSGPGLELFDPPAAAVVTLAATALAAVACAATAWWALRYGRRAAHEPAAPEGELGTEAPPDGDPGRGAAVPEDEERRAAGFAGFLLSVLSLVTVVFVGVPAVLFPSC